MDKSSSQFDKYLDSESLNHKQMLKFQQNVNNKLPTAYKHSINMCISNQNLFILCIIKQLTRSVRTMLQY